MLGFCCLFKISSSDAEKLLSILNGPWVSHCQRASGWWYGSHREGMEIGNAGVSVRIPYSTSWPEGPQQDKHFARHPPPRQPPPLRARPPPWLSTSRPSPSGPSPFRTTPTSGPSSSQQPVFTSAPSSVPPNFHTSPQGPHPGVFSPLQHLPQLNEDT